MIDFLGGTAIVVLLILLGFWFGSAVTADSSKKKKAEPQAEAPPGGFVCQCGHGFNEHHQFTESDDVGPCAHHGCACQVFCWNGVRS